MYEVDDQDVVVELNGIPQSSIGAPNPVVIAGEHDVLLAYYLQDTPTDWDGTSVRVVGEDSESESVAIIKFSNYYAHMFGPPNDETLNGHPLSARGLKPYSAFAVNASSWLRRLEKMNSVHSFHSESQFMEHKRHLIFTFHDSTFECIASVFTVEVRVGSIKRMISDMIESVR